jgi:hypothetical protein
VLVTAFFDTVVVVVDLVNLGKCDRRSQTEQLGRRRWGQMVQGMPSAPLCPCRLINAVGARSTV